MKRGATIGLQALIVLTGIGALALMLWFPHLEGRNARATTFQIYFNDPFLAYAYTASLAFYLALHQGFRLLAFAREGTLFSPSTVKAVRNIKYCALALIGFVVGGFLVLFQNESDDRAGGVFLGVMISSGSLVVATAAALAEQYLQKGIDRKPEADRAL